VVAVTREFLRNVKPSMGYYTRLEENIFVVDNIKLAKQILKVKKIKEFIED
jgi:hypothetical protein